MQRAVILIQVCRYLDFPDLAALSNVSKAVHQGLAEAGIRGYRCETNQHTKRQWFWIAIPGNRVAMKYCDTDGVVKYSLDGCVIIETTKTLYLSRQYNELQYEKDLHIITETTIIPRIYTDVSKHGRALLMALYYASISLKHLRFARSNLLKIIRYFERDPAVSLKSLPLCLLNDLANRADQSCLLILAATKLGIYAWRRRLSNDCKTILVISRDETYQRDSH